VRYAIEARVPVMTTMGDPAAFPNDHPLYFGTIGAAGHPSAHAYVNEQADLVVAVGTGLGSMVRQPISKGLSRARLAVVNVDPGEAKRALNPAIVVESDAGAAFAALGALHAADPFQAPKVAYELTRYRAQLVEPHRESLRLGRAAQVEELRQSEAIAQLEARLPESGHVLFDAGNCAAAAIHGMRMPRGASSTIALGMGGMGYAIAGAIGAQLGESPRTRTVVLCGDGAFLMLGLEIHTAVELGLPILFVVFNNGAHGMCVTRQQMYFEGRVDSSRYARVDVATMVRGMGDSSRLWVGRAASAAQLRTRLDEYAVAPGPGVLELVLTREEVPPFAPFLRPEAPTVRVAGAAPQGAQSSAA
jgi:acetolactate synthase-1/2/3 large subunit